MLTNYGIDIILDTDNIDERDPEGQWSIGSYDPSFVGGCAFDPIRRYPNEPESDVKQ